MQETKLRSCRTWGAESQVQNLSCRTSFAESCMQNPVYTIPIPVCTSGPLWRRNNNQFLLLNQFIPQCQHILHQALLGRTNAGHALALINEQNKVTTKQNSLQGYRMQYHCHCHWCLGRWSCCTEEGLAVTVGGLGEGGGRGWWGDAGAGRPSLLLSKEEGGISCYLHWLLRRADWWEELAVTSGSSWDELTGAGSCALLYSRGQEVDLR